MRASSGMLLLSLALATTIPAQAGPQSILDPYAGIQAPKSAAKQEGARTVTFTGKSVQLKSFGNTKDKSEKPAAPTSGFKTAASQSSGDGGILSGTKQIGDGIAKTTKGAVGGVFSGTKKIGSGLAHGLKNSGLFLSKGAKAVGHGVVAAGSKVKDGAEVVGEKTAVAPKAIGHGMKVTGEKLKDGSVAAGHAVVQAPKAIGHGVKVGGEKVADTSGSVFGKLNPFKHKGSSAPVATAGAPTVTK